MGEDHADDVVQEAWQAALSHQGDAPDSWPRWMTRVTQRIAWKRRVQGRNRRDRERSVQSAKAAPAPDDLIAGIEEKQLLERALLELDEPYRSALLMRYYGDLPMGEVASRAGRSASTTRTHVQRGLEQLRAKLEAKHGANWSAALLPFLLPKGAGAKGALGATVKGLSLLTAMKFVSLNLLALLIAGYGASRFTEAGGLPESVVTGALPPPATVPISEQELSPIEASAEKQSRTVTAPEFVPLAVDPESVSVAPDRRAEPSTRVLQVEEASGRPLSGIGAIAHYTKVKRGLFTSHTEWQTLDVETDGEGLIDLPFQMTEEAQRSAYFDFDLGPGFPGDCRCRFRGAGQDGVLKFVLEERRLAWVQLPEALSADESAALKATWTLNTRVSGERVQFGHIAPVVTLGREPRNPAYSRHSRERCHPPLPDPRCRQWRCHSRGARGHLQASVKPAR